MDKQIRAIMAGCGGMSGAWLRAAGEIPGLKIVGLVDIVVESAKQKAEKFKLADAMVGTDPAYNMSGTISATAVHVQP